MKRVLRENGLSLTLLALFLLSQLGLTFAGWKQYNDEQSQHHKSQIIYTEYLQSNSLLETTMENWESEFLQMYAFIILSTNLYQRGSVVSKKLEGENDVDADPRQFSNRNEVPWPVKKGGWILFIYERSLSLAFLGLFLITFFLHAVGGAHLYNEEQLMHGQAPLTIGEYLLSAQFWFESLQNWQSEFFSLALMVILSIFLRQRYSPESKPVACPHSEIP